MNEEMEKLQFQIILLESTGNTNILFELCLKNKIHILPTVPHRWYFYPSMASVNPCYFIQNDCFYYLSACEQLAMTLLQIQFIHLFLLTDRQP